ncbi:MAG TPA: nuclear transport factor 2 family protein [Longimicrobiales bacterium]|nr:nuclear transport factor 2 family protein [Longimicrobiales bacterium]
MESNHLDNWLAAYGLAWERSDAQAFAALFTPDVHYHWTPFEEARVGRDAVAQAFEAAVVRQRDIRFAASVLSRGDPGGIAHWQCSFRRAGADYTVRLDGMLMVEFADSGLCRIFREWWHSDEGVLAIPGSVERKASTSAD